jgi:hypothetical protein
MQYISFLSFLKLVGDGPTDRRTDIVTYIAAIAAKNEEIPIFEIRDKRCFAISSFIIGYVKINWAQTLI